MNREMGGVMIAFGLVAGIGGFFAWSYFVCTLAIGSSCFAGDYPYRDVGLLAMIFGGILFVVGMVILASGGQLYPRIRESSPLVPAYHVPTLGSCPICGERLLWVPDSGRAYCTTCGAYR